MDKIDQGFIDRFLPNGSASVSPALLKLVKDFNQDLFLIIPLLSLQVLPYL